MLMKSEETGKRGKKDGRIKEERRYEEEHGKYICMKEKSYLKTYRPAGKHT